MPAEFSIPDDMLSPITAQVEANLAAQLGVQQLEDTARLAVADRVREAVDTQLNKNLAQIAGQAVKGSNIGVGGAGKVGVSESLRLGLRTSGWSRRISSTSTCSSRAPG